MKGTEADRETLRDRVKSALGSRTQKELESMMDVSPGTLTRMFGGRRKVDAELIDNLANALGVDATDIVQGTTFAELLEHTLDPASSTDASADLETEETLHDDVVPSAQAAEAPTVHDDGQDEAEPELMSVEDEPTATTLPSVPTVPATLGEATGEGDPEETLPVPDPEPAVAQAAEEPEPEAQAEPEPVVEEAVDPSLDAETLNGEAPQIVAEALDTAQAIDVDAAPESDEEETEEEEAPKPKGFGGRMMRFFSSIFGG